MSDDDAVKAARFRSLALRTHALLETSDDAESRHTFHLPRGTLVTSRHLMQITALVKAAEAAWGRGKGEHKELLELRAASSDLSPSVPVRNIEWRHGDKQPGTVRFGDWLADQAPLFR